MGFREEIVLPATNPHDLRPPQEGVDDSDTPLAPVQPPLDDLYRAGSILGEAALLADAADTDTQNLTSNTTLGDGHTFFCDPSGGDFTVTLPAASEYPGRIYVIKRTNTSGVLTIARTGSDTIDGGTTWLPVGYQSVTVQSDGSSGWWVI